MAHNHSHGSGETEEEQEARLEREEREALGRIVHSIHCYKPHAESDVERWERNYEKLPSHHKALLSGVPAKCKTARDCIHFNTTFFKSLLSVFDSGGDFCPPPHLADANAAGLEHAHRVGRCASPGDMEKVNYVLKNLMRDWSEDGATEREQSYGRILQELKRLFADRPSTEDPPNILVPGAGLGRLCLEIASLGFRAEGNEFSYYMLLASSFMLNHTVEANQWTIFPWVQCSNNNKSDADQLKAVQIPDVVPASMVPGPGLLGMCGGDFVEVYSSPDYQGTFDSVATNFFIDTAHNIVEYLEIIAGVLKPGGHWVNFGPLLYHWADAHTYMSSEELSIEISLEDVKRIAETYGLKCLKEDFSHAAYTSNPRSMFQTVYNCVCWTMVKAEPSS